MSGPRRHITMGLVLFVCALTGRSVSAPSAAPPTVSQQQQEEERDDYSRMMEAVRHVGEGRGLRGVRIEVPLTTRSRMSALESRDLRNPWRDRGEQVAVFPKNLKKGKFLQHIAGPLYFSHKCRKHAYRLYHQTRDCTIPAYFKRCARLLTRLAVSPQCTEG